MLTYNGIVITTFRSTVSKPQNTSFALSVIAAAIGIPSENEGEIFI
jgi:hypothetical protein